MDSLPLSHLPSRRCQFYPWVGKIPSRRKWQPLQYSCLRNPMDREALLATVHEVSRVEHDWTSNTLMGFRGGTSGTEPACQCRTCKRHGFDPCIGKIPRRRAWQPTPVFLPGESPWTDSLKGYRPRGHKKLYMTEANEDTHIQLLVIFIWPKGSLGFFH